MTNSLVKLVRSFSLSLTFFFFRRMDINIGSDTFITLAIQATSMNTSPSVLADEEYIRAAPDSQLSSSNLLSNLLKEEDQYHYNQLLNIQVPHHIQHTLHQVRSLFFSLQTSSPYLSFCAINSYVHFFILHLLLYGWQLSY